jgi:precorrin-2 dehydrogenase/sirohydrochlorin ferrochelatase
MNVYPIFLNNLADRRCVVIGGGPEAERKVESLLDCEALVTVISPDLSDRLRQWAEANRLVWLSRPYQPGDLTGAFLVIVSERDPDATEPIWQKALINAMDDVPHCTFVAGSVVRRGPLVISISTSGCAPALSVRLRQRLEQTLEPEYDRFLELMGALRAPMADHFPDFEERRRRWYALVDSDILALLKAGNLDAVYQRIEDIMGEDAAFSLPTT